MNFSFWIRTPNVWGEGVGSIWTPADNGGGLRGIKNWQNLVDVFYGWPLIPFLQANISSFTSEQYNN